ncbi:MAG: hypothetical protein C3F13_13320 [Anaerolineales bacterium]|nr:hypothetical protein [Anaerolineae bacterium]PWB51417.1 MAG: hypothetical protein C3F13_13320 [Anaerolineales bacterium]
MTARLIENDYNNELSPEMMTIRILLHLAVTRRFFEGFLRRGNPLIAEKSNKLSDEPRHRIDGGRLLLRSVKKNLTSLIAMTIAPRCAERFLRHGNLHVA